MITVRCFCGAKQEFHTMREEAEDAGWWANPAPGGEPSDLCPAHNTNKSRTEGREEEE
jgi:hypothetical protein